MIRFQHEMLHITWSTQQKDVKTKDVVQLSFVAEAHLRNMRWAGSFRPITGPHTLPLNFIHSNNFENDLVTPKSSHHQLDAVVAGRWEILQSKPAT
mmetsp:Transcript_8984/g.15710  ORF Transcript_8984/g.15710 Transcript_8984/m.15710 type:complete len:96 (-) Transcript_8984:46-333(-)